MIKDDIKKNINELIEVIEQEVLIEAGFDSYRENVMPKKLHQNQLTETEKAFYAGAAHLLGGFLILEHLPDEQIKKFLQSLLNELDKFSASVLSKQSIKH